MNNWISKFIKPKLKSLFKKKSADRDDTLWQNCSCSKLTLKEDFEKNLFVCPSCNKPHPLTNKQRFELFFDDSEYQILDYGRPPEDPISFEDTKKYKDRIKKAKELTGEDETMTAASGFLNAVPITAVSMTFSWMGGSVSPRVGECFLNAAEHAIKNNHKAFVMFITSGGMRMQTGNLSLQQMGRMTIAMHELKKKNILTFSIAAGPVLGGTTASFASISDQIYSESDDYLWGFSGKRVIEQNIREKLADDVQTSKWVFDHGQIDKIIPRHKLRDEIYNLLSILLKLKEKEEAQDRSNVTVDKSLQAAS